MVYSLLWVVQDFVHQPQLQALGVLYSAPMYDLEALDNYTVLELSVKL